MLIGDFLDIRIKTSKSPSIIIFNKKYNYVFKIWLNKKCRNQVKNQYSIANERYDSLFDSLDYELKVYEKIKDLMNKDPIRLPFLNFVSGLTDFGLEKFCKIYLELSNENDLDSFYKVFNDYLCSLDSEDLLACEELKLTRYTKTQIENMEINFTMTTYDKNSMSLRDFLEKIFKFYGRDFKSYTSLAYIYAYIFIQILYGLTVLYENEIVHGDLHPGNIMITNNLQVLIYDWNRSFSSKIGKNNILNGKVCQKYGKCNEFRKDIPTDFCWIFIDHLIKKMPHNTVRLAFLQIVFPVINIKNSSDGLFNHLVSLLDVPRNFVFLDGGNIVTNTSQSVEFKREVKKIFGVSIYDIFSKSFISTRHTEYMQNLKKNKLVSDKFYNSYLDYVNYFKSLSDFFGRKGEVASVENNKNEMRIVLKECKFLDFKLKILENEYRPLLVNCKESPKKLFLTHDTLKDKNQLLQIVAKDKIRDYIYYTSKKNFLGHNKSDWVKLNFDSINRVRYFGKYDDNVEKTYRELEKKYFTKSSLTDSEIDILNYCSNVINNGLPKLFVTPFRSVQDVYEMVQTIFYGK